MNVINLLDELKNRKTKKDNITNLFEEKLNKRIDDMFETELFEERIKVFKTYASNSEKSKKQRLIVLESIERKYFEVSNSFENKITLLSYECMMSDKYCGHLVDYIKSNIDTIIREGEINYTIEILEDLELDNKKIKDLINYLKELRSGKVTPDYGGVAPSYRNIQSSIPIGSEYNFQKA
ncbi:MAG: hypothetical protein ACRC1T_05660 [Clostridium chrysemydis]|uniref:hypothetical protein n=1 Tax=Clostridium chrysemydis TaxID=2665504 RepID=UPI003F3805B7